MRLWVHSEVIARIVGIVQSEKLLNNWSQPSLVGRECRHPNTRTYSSVTARLIENCSTRTLNNIEDGAMSCHAECLELGMLTQMLLLSFEIRDIISTILCCVVDTLKTYLMMFNFENLKTKMICVCLLSRINFHCETPSICFLRPCILFDVLCRELTIFSSW